MGKYSIKNLCFELRIGPLVLAWASDADVILMLKADYIYNRVVRYPEMLEIYMNGVPWLFDEKLSYKKASRLIAAHSVGKYIFV